MKTEGRVALLRFLNRAHDEGLITDDEFAQCKRRLLAECFASCADSPPSPPCERCSAGGGKVLAAQAELLRNVSDAVQYYYDTIGDSAADSMDRASSLSATLPSASLFFAAAAQPFTDAECVHGQNDTTKLVPNDSRPQLDPLQVDLSRLFSTPPQGTPRRQVHRQARGKSQTATRAQS
jgi:hypothetical protein